jgi:hypothetical protein
VKGRLKTAPLMLLLVGASASGWGSFQSRGQIALSASATATGGSALTITAASLPAQAFFGKNLMVPVQITSNSGPINPNNLQVNIVYQLTDATGQALNPPTSVPIQFVPGPANGNKLQGTAIINRSDLAPVQNGGSIQYVFSARQGGSNTVLGSLGISQVPSGGNVLASPFKTTIIDQLCAPVAPSGANVSAPDLSASDGRTTVSLPQGSVSTPGRLCIQQGNANAAPAGPNGAPAASIYTISLQDTILTGTAEIVLSYPADISGNVLPSAADPGSLGIYWLDQTNGAFAGGEWHALSRATLDSTLHTLTGMTSHFSTFALFAAGAIASADLRPNERIITPNGDGINDVARFGTGIDEVKIFDMRGRRVKVLPGPTPQWDGTDDTGKIVESGVYLYQYTSLGDRISGVIGVAK